jgi:D-amino-acid oxidase
MSSNRTYRITIVGAGIIGLTTACTLLKEYADNDNIHVTIVSEQFSPFTTGDVSAGYWEPYGLDRIDERILRWASYTYNIFLDEYFSTKAARAGIIQMPSYMLRTSSNMTPAFSTLVQHFRTLGEHELNMFKGLPAKSGFVMSTVVVEVSKYLPQLQHYLARDVRVTFVSKKIHSFNELKDHADLVINCSGLSSRYLANDTTIRPARGQVGVTAQVHVISFLEHIRTLRSYVYMRHGSKPCTCSIRAMTKDISFLNRTRSFSAVHFN